MSSRPVSSNDIVDDTLVRLWSGQVKTDTQLSNFSQGKFIAPAFCVVLVNKKPVFTVNLC